jgi:YegS/Rv2252/BmrU family lipid kinase
MSLDQSTIHPDHPATSKGVVPTSEGNSPPSRGRRYRVVLNDRAGSVANAARADDLVLRFKAAGLEAATAPDAPLAAKIAAAIDSDADVIVAAGGDGTVTAVASALVGTHMALAILPLGTVNLLARDLGIPLDLDAAIAALAAMQPRKIDVGEVNGAVFLHKIVFGFVPGLAAARERLRGRGLLGTLAYLPHVVRRIRLARRLTVEIETGNGRRRTMRVAAFAVSNNPYDEGFGRFFRRSCLDGGSLGLYALKRPDLWTMIKVAIGMLIGRWRQSEEITVGAARKVVIRSTRRRMMLMVDGEVFGFDVPLRVGIRPGALTVLAPSGAAAAAASDARDRVSALAIAPG